MQIFIKSRKDGYYDRAITTNYAYDVILLIDDTKTPTEIHSVEKAPPTRPVSSESDGGPSRRSKKSVLRRGASRRRSRTAPRKRA